MYIATRQKQYDYVMPGWATLLRNLISTMRSAKLNNSEYKIFWKRNVNKNLPREQKCAVDDFILPDFSIFFKNDIAIDHIPENAKTYSSWKLQTFDEDFDNNNNNNNKETIELLINSCMDLGGQYDIQMQIPDYIEKIPNSIKNKYCECLNELILSDEMENDINTFYNNNFDNNTISLLIRTWPEDARRSKWYVLDKFTSYINKFHKDSKIFVSVDVEHEPFIKLLKTKCNNEIFYNDMSDKTYNDIYRKALINMYLASRTKYIIGSKHSNYPEFCWWLSNCKSKFTVL